jgi:hypothetical protein
MSDTASITPISIIVVTENDILKSKDDNLTSSHRVLRPRRVIHAASTAWSVHDSENSSSESDSDYGSPVSENDEEIDTKSTVVGEKRQRTTENGLPIPKLQLALDDCEIQQYLTLSPRWIPSSPQYSPKDGDVFQ